MLDLFLRSDSIFHNKFYSILTQEHQLNKKEKSILHFLFIHLKLINFERLPVIDFTVAEGYRVDAFVYL